MFNSETHLLKPGFEPRSFCLSKYPINSFVIVLFLNSHLEQYLIMTYTNFLQLKIMWKNCIETGNQDIRTLLAQLAEHLPENSTRGFLIYLKNKTKML